MVSTTSPQNIPALIAQTYPDAAYGDICKLVIAFYSYRLALSVQQDGIRELILFNRHFSKVDASRNDPFGQTSRYNEVKRVLMFQLSLIYEEAVNDYEQCRLDCARLIAAHDEEIRKLQERMIKAPVHEKEAICQEIALFNLSFLERARELKAKLEASKERIHA